MDITTQIKDNLILRIKDSEDLNFLQALQTIFDTSEQSLYQLSPEQLESIKTGREDMRRGDFYENKQVISEMKEWLEKK
jgi:hypothetical protein